MKTKGPKLFTAMKGYTKKQLTKDIVAGILVAIIAFPLSVALAISSGMSPETGLYSAIIGGFFVSAFGGSKVNIGGVTAATVMTVFTIIEEFGLAGLAVASMIAGVILILLGILKAGVLLRYIPRTITLGFTAGIAMGIFSGQLKGFFGKKVLVAAADTFRAAAIEQLTEWAHRAEVDIIAQKEGSDPAAVVFDAVTAAKARNVDVLLCDTAGRLHNKKNLMEELKKIDRIIEREYPGCYRETMVVLDGTTGQNALVQAKEFNAAAAIDGIILTKLDGTAKGGIALAIQSELSVPVKYIGVGEHMEDLQKFDPDAFIDALFDGIGAKEEE